MRIKTENERLIKGLDLKVDEIGVWPARSWRRNGQRIVAVDSLRLTHLLEGKPDPKGQEQDNGDCQKDAVIEKHF